MLIQKEVKDVKIRIIATLSIILFTLSGMASAEKLLNGRVISVILYQNGAIVKKTVKVCNQMVNIFIPESADTSSIRVKSQIPIAAISIKKVFSSTEQTASIKKLKEKLSEKQDILDGKLAKLKALKESLKLMMSIKPPAKTEKLDELLAYIQNKTEAYASKELKLKRNVKRLRNEIAAIEREIKLMSGKKIFQKAVQLSLKSAPKKEQSLTISYFVRSASWRPRYILSIENDRIRIRYTAAIQQRSKEEWKDIKLNLGTKKTIMPQNPPRPYRLIVDIAKPIRMKKTSFMPTAATNLIREKVVTSEELVGFNLQIPRKISIPPDGKPHLIDIYQGYIPATLSYISKPFLTNHVFIKASLKNTTKIPWIRGRATFFANNELLQKGMLKSILPQEQADVFFGVDERFEVKRYKKQALKGEKGIFSKEKQIAYTYNIEIRNTHNTPKDVVIQEIIPISENQKVKVVDVRFSPKPTEEKDGIVKWKVKIAAHSQKQLTIRYKIVYPTGKEITFKRWYY